MSKDHRARVSRMMIEQAFLKLLAERPIESISVKALCEEAGISRGTFYAHYQDLNAVLERIVSCLTEQIQQALEELDTPAEDAQSLVAVCASIFECLKENAALCGILLQDYRYSSFIDGFLLMGKETCLKVYARYFKDADPRRISCFYAFVSAGCIGLLRQWVQQGMEASALDVALTAESIMLHGIDFLLPRKG